MTFLNVLSNDINDDEKMKKIKMCAPGIEPGSSPCKGEILTIKLRAPLIFLSQMKDN